MAKEKKQAESTPEPVRNNPQEKPAGLLHSVIVIFVALLVVALVSFCVFYFFTRNNINGFADTVRPWIKDKPILRLALPKEREPIDPDAPENLTQKELVKKYNEYREKVKNLTESLEKANQEIARMEQENKAAEDAEAILNENQALLETIKQEQEALKAEKETISRMIASGDREGFRAYFEKVDKATAAEIYKEIIEKTVIDEETAKLAKSFAEMEPARAAQVLTELFSSDSETALDIIESMKADKMALILERMDPKVAAEIISMLAMRKADL